MMDGFGASSGSDSSEDLYSNPESSLSLDLLEMSEKTQALMQLFEQNEGKSEYFQKLSGGDVRQRYIDKIEFINDVDPFTLTPDSQYRIPNNQFPKMNFADLWAYFLHSKSYYSGDQLASYKSLEAYKYVEAKFIRNLIAFKIGDFFVALGQVCEASINVFKNLYFIRQINLIYDMLTKNLFEMTTIAYNQR